MSKKRSNFIKPQLKKEKCNYCVYIGVTIPKLIQTGTVFKCFIEEIENDYIAKTAINRYPLIKHLIVSSELLPESRIKINTPGNLLYENNRKLSAEVMKEGIK